MLLFGHIGITAGVVKTVDMLLVGANFSRGHPESRSKGNAASRGLKTRLISPFSKMRDGLDAVDYRLVIAGSLLPDIVDKPVWLLVAGDASLSGRGYTHTLLFNLVLLLGGVVLVRLNKTWPLVISLASLMHLVLDQIWTSPAVMLWPLLGPLPALETAGWLHGIFQGLFSYPGVYIPELIGLLIVLLFAYRLMVEKRVFGFIRDGIVY